MGALGRWLRSLAGENQASANAVTRDQRPLDAHELKLCRAQIRTHKVLRDEYMSADQDQMRLRLDSGGMPTGHLARDRNRLLVVTPAGKVNPKSVHAYKVGIFSFTIRGTGYYEDACGAGDFSPGAHLRLVREPNNPFDPAAIAIYAAGASSKLGHVNKLNAKRLAPRMDRGEELVAIRTLGEPPGIKEYLPHVPVAPGRVLRYLLRDTRIPVP